MASIQETGSQFFGKLLSPIKTFEVKGMLLSPSYLHAGLIVLLLFILVLSLARLRRLYVNWSLGRPSMAMAFWGFLLALVLEGFLLIGGRTFTTEILGWKNPPKLIKTALDAGRKKLVEVLGINQEIPQSTAKSAPTVESLIGQFQSLSPEKAEEFKKILCAPQ